MSFTEDEYVTLSALQHYVFCPRQCALIHVERIWAENGLTTLGKIEHERVDTAPGTTHGNLRMARAVQLACHRLGIRGKADAVEYEFDTSSNDEFDQEMGARRLIRVTPIEYKHGRPKEHSADAVQLCAQALCLEEMHGISIPHAYIFYRQTRRRLKILLDDALRAQTQDIIAATRQLLLNGTLPPALRRKECDSCSLFEHCLPRSTSQTVTAYNERNFHQLTDDV